MAIKGLVDTATGQSVDPDIRYQSISTTFLPGYTIAGYTGLQASGGTLAIPLDGRSYTYTLSGHIAIACSGAPAAPVCADTVIVLMQAASGGPWGISSWPVGIKWPGGVAQTMPQTASARMRVVISTDALGVIDVCAMWMGV